jgi:hypothetical protein
MKLWKLVLQRSAKTIGHNSVVYNTVSLCLVYEALLVIPELVFSSTLGMPLPSLIKT